MLASRGALGAAFGVAQPAIRRNVILADPAHTGRNLGRLGVIEVVGFAATPAVTALLADAFNLDVPFYALAGVATATVLAMGPAPARRERPRHQHHQLLAADAGPGGGRHAAAGHQPVRDDRGLGGGVGGEPGRPRRGQVGGGPEHHPVRHPLGALAPVAGAWAQRTGGLWLCVGGMTGSRGGGRAAGRVRLGVGPGGGVDADGGRRRLGFTAGLYAYSQTVPDDRQASSQGLKGAFEVLLAGLTSVLGAWLYDIAGRMLVWTGDPGADGAGGGGRAGMARGAGRRR